MSIHLGSALQRWRQNAGLTQAAAADTVGVSQSTISASEDGRLSMPLFRRLVTLYAPKDSEVVDALIQGEPNGEGVGA
jgi:transcriptional regulator with XRE-family HTH domain